MFILWFLYVLLMVLFVLWLIAWISMPFKLDRVNQNLEEIKGILAQKSTKKKSAK